METGTIIISLASLPIIYLMFSHVNSRPEYFFLGIALCLTSEVILLSFYCLYKLQSAYRFSQTIIINQNKNLNPEIDYPFVKYPVIDKFYYNKYTEEARLFARKKQLKMAETQNQPTNDYFRAGDSIQQNQMDGQKRKSIMFFLRQIRGYYDTLNRFNNSLVYFGKNMKKIEDEGFITKKKYFFTQFQMNYPSEVILHELIDEQKEILYKTKTKLKIRKDNQKLLFPNWFQVVNVLKNIGAQFQKIEIMRQSNSEMLEMIHKKVLEDYQLLENKIEQLKKNLQQTKNNKYQLNKDYKKYKAQEINQNTSNQPHLQMRYWVKKKIYQFRDLERRIRENQRQQTNYIRQLKYYKQKLSTFSDQNKHKYLKILKTRFIAFLDSYYITVDQSIKQVQLIFTAYQSYNAIRPPKVSKLKVTKNMNETIENQRTYQKQYFDRVLFYQDKLDGMIHSLQSFGVFFDKLQKIWAIMIDNLKSCEKKQQKTMRYFNKLFRYMIEKSNNLQRQINQLKQINGIFTKINLPQLNQIKYKMKNKKIASSDLLADIVVDTTPIQYRYQIVKTQIESNYKQLEDLIEKIKEFEQIYLIHSSRMKKILLVELINYLNFQKVSLNFGQINEKNLHDGQYDVMEENIMLEDLDQQNNEFFDDGFDKIQNLQTGYGLSKQHLKLLNQFLFVAYSQWKQSQFFKKTLSQQLYIIFNSEPNQNFSNVQVDSMNFSGDPPQIVSIKQLKSQQNQIFIDVQLAFKGKYELNMKTLLKIFRSNWNISIRANFQAFYCVMRLCFVPTKVGRGKSWFSFIGEPIAKIDISLKIQDLISFDQQPVKNLFANFLNNKMKKFIYPIKQSINIPVSIKSDQLIKIQKRLKLAQSEIQI